MVFALPAAAIILMLSCQWLIYVYAPVEATMGLAQKIFYLHLPLSWWALTSFFLVFICSLAYLWKKSPRMDLWARVFAEIGVLFSGLALLTGMIWARNSWGVWWTWDPRLSTTLIMWFVYCGYLVLGQVGGSEKTRANLRAALGIVAFLDVPLVFISARLFRSIHPAVFASSSGGLEPEMLLTLLAVLAGMGFVWLLLCRLRQGLLELKLVCEKLEQHRIYGNFEK